jgi:hypothetical protein
MSALTKAAQMTLTGLLLIIPTTQSTSAFSQRVSEGMYVLTATTGLDGGTCTPDQMLPPFSYLYYRIQANSVAELIYLGTPGAQIDVITLPKPRDSLRWHGEMTWTLNPLTFAPPSVTTAFHFEFTSVGDMSFLMNGKIEVPTSSGGTCTEVISYTGVRTGQ